MIHGVLPPMCMYSPSEHKHAHSHTQVYREASFSVESATEALLSLSIRHQSKCESDAPQDASLGLSRVRDAGVGGGNEGGEGGEGVGVGVGDGVEDGEGEHHNMWSFLPGDVKTLIWDLLTLKERSRAACVRKPKPETRNVNPEY